MKKNIAIVMLAVVALVCFGAGYIQHKKPTQITR